MYSAGYYDFVGVSTAGSIKWAQTIYNEVQGIPAIAQDGTIYVGSQSNLFYALFPTGSIKWSFGTSGNIYSSPTIDNYGIIYFGCNDYNLYALYPTGSIVWSYYMLSNVKSSPAIGSDGTIYVGTAAGVLYAMNSNGSPNWFTITASATFDISSPVIGPDGTIYIGSISSDNSLYAFTQLGSIKWKYVTTGAIYSTPSITPGGDIVFYANGDYHVYCVTPGGSLLWTFLMESYSSSTSPVVDANGVIYASTDSLYAIYPTGSLKWKALVNLSPLTPAIGNNGLVYVVSGNYIYTIGNLILTQSPSLLPPQGLLTSPSPKFRGSLSNEVFIKIQFLSMIINLFNY